MDQLTNKNFPVYLTSTLVPTAHFHDITWTILNFFMTGWSYIRLSAIHEQKMSLDASDKNSSPSTLSAPFWHQADE